MPPCSSVKTTGRVAGLATSVMLQFSQLVVPKIQQHPLSFALRATFKIDEKHPPHQGNRSRTVGDGQIISRFDFPAATFSMSFSVSDMYWIRSW